jgi:hypothetical protein
MRKRRSFTRHIRFVIVVVVVVDTSVAAAGFVVDDVDLEGTCTI